MPPRTTIPIQSSTLHLVSSAMSVFDMYDVSIGIKLDSVRILSTILPQCVVDIIVLTTWIQPGCCVTICMIVLLKAATAVVPLGGLGASVVP